MLTIVSLLPILAVIVLTSLSQPEPVMMDDLLKKVQEKYDYINQHANREVPSREYSAVMHLANDDLKRAVEILNDPDYPEKFYDENGVLPLP